MSLNPTPLALARPDDLELEIRRCAGLTREGLELVAAIRRRNGPVVDVPKGAVHGFFMSSKMKRTCRFASRTAELVHLASLDQPRHPALEFHEQPCFFEGVRYRKPDALRESVVTEIPDALVIERVVLDGLRTVVLRFVEVKLWAEMEKLAKAQPWRYQLGEEGRGHDRVLERYCQERFAIPHQIWTQREVPKPLYDNWGYVESYVLEPIDVPGAVRKEAKRLARLHPGGALAELYAHLRKFAPVHADELVDFANQLFAERTLFGNLHEVHLKDAARLRVFADEVIADTLLNEAPVRPVNRGRIRLEAGASFQWGETLWRIGPVSAESIGLVTADGKRSWPITRDLFEKLVFEGQIHGLPEAPPTAATYLAHLSDAGAARATKKLKRMNAIRAGASEPRNSTERGWVREADLAEADHLPWFAAAKPKFHLIGQNRRRVSRACVDLAVEVLETYFLHNLADGGLSMRDTYQQYKRLARERGVRTIARGTLSSILESTWSGEEIARARLGMKAAIQVRARRPLATEAPPHGDRPHGRCHIDHSPIDLFLIDPLTGEVLETRATLTLVRDAYSGRILAYALRYGPPSMDSIHLVIRDYVRRWRRMPKVFVVDNAFGSKFFVELCAAHRTQIDIRAAYDARAGGPIEEGIGRVMEFCHKLRGSTVTLRKPREMDPRFDPRDRAIWSIETFETKALQPFLFKYFDEEPLRVPGVSPRDLYDEGIRLTGQRPNEFIDPEETAFLAWSALPPRRGKKVHDRFKIERDGFSIVGIPYWNDLFAENAVIGSTVRVREEPEDIGVAYAWLKGEWHVCKTDRFPGLADMPQPLRALASKELRIRLGRDKVVTPEMVQFIADLKERERAMAATQKPISNRPQLRMVTDNGGDLLSRNDDLAVPVHEVPSGLRPEDVPDLDADA